MTSININKQLSPLENKRKTLIGHYTSLISKIHEAIGILENTGKFLMC